MISELAYKKLPDSVQNWSSFLLHLFILLFAVSIKDIAVVFEFVGAIGSSFNQYFFPAVGLLLASKLTKKR